MDAAIVNVKDALATSSIQPNNRFCSGRRDFDNDQDEDTHDPDHRFLLMKCWHLLFVPVYKGFMFKWRIRSDPKYSLFPQPSAKRPRVSTAFEQNTPSARSNGASRSNSPDPHGLCRLPPRIFGKQMAQASTQACSRAVLSVRKAHSTEGVLGSGQS